MNFKGEKKAARFLKLHIVQQSKEFVTHAVLLDEKRLRKKRKTFYNYSSWHKNMNKPKKHQNYFKFQ